MSNKDIKQKSWKSRKKHGKWTFFCSLMIFSMVSGTFANKDYAETKVEQKSDSSAYWVKNNTGWWYKNADGSYPYNKWEEINGKWYYFNEAGYCVINTWVGNYYLGSDGAMLVDTTTPDGYKVDKNGKWISENGKWVKNNIGWWYENADGSYPYNKWEEINGKWYYFNEAGYSVVNTWIDVYYLGSDGAMLVDTITPDGYKVDKNGKWVPELKTNKEEKKQEKENSNEVGKSDGILVPMLNNKEENKKDEEEHKLPEENKKPEINDKLNTIISKEIEETKNNGRLLDIRNKISTLEKLKENFESNLPEDGIITWEMESKLIRISIDFSEVKSETKILISKLPENERTEFEDVKVLKIELRTPEVNAPYDTISTDNALIYLQNAIYRLKDTKKEYKSLKETPESTEELTPSESKIGPGRKLTKEEKLKNLKQSFESDKEYVKKEKSKLSEEDLSVIDGLEILNEEIETNDEDGTVLENQDLKDVQEKINRAKQYKTLFERLKNDLAGVFSHRYTGKLELLNEDFEKSKKEATELKEKLSKEKESKLKNVEILNETLEIPEINDVNYDGIIDSEGLANVQEKLWKFNIGSEFSDLRIKHRIITEESILEFQKVKEEFEIAKEEIKSLIAKLPENERKALDGIDKLDVELVIPKVNDVNKNGIIDSRELTDLQQDIYRLKDYKEKIEKDFSGKLTTEEQRRELEISKESFKKQKEKVKLLKEKLSENKLKYLKNAEILDEELNISEENGNVDSETVDNMELKKVQDIIDRAKQYQLLFDLLKEEHFGYARLDEVEYFKNLQWTFLGEVDKAKKLKEKLPQNKVAELKNLDILEVELEMPNIYK